jgi:O-antigen ligase
MVNHKNIRLLIKLVVNLIIFCAPVIFWQASMDPFGPPQLMAVRVFVPLLFLLYALKCRVEGRIVLKKNPVLLPLSMYLAVSLISVLFAMNRQISLKYLYEMILFVYGAYMIYAVSDKRDIDRIFTLIMVSHTCMAAYGITQHFGADIFAWNTNFAGRPMGTIGNPDFFAGQLLFPVFMLAAYAAFGKKFRAAAIAGLVINVICLAYTKVLGAFIGFGAGAAAIGIVYLVKNREYLAARKKSVAAALAIMVAAAAVISPFAVKKAGNFLQDKKRSMTHRLLMWESSLLMIKESPVFGKGIGNYRLYYPKYQARLLADPKNKEYDYVVTWMPHENYLLIAAETGIISLGIFLLAVFVFYGMCYDIFIRKKYFDPAPAGMMAAVTAVLAASFFNTFYNIAGTTLYFFVMMFAVKLYSGETGARVFDGKKAGLAAAAAAVLLLLFIAADGKTMAANIYLKRGARLEKDRNFGAAISYYDRILSLNPVELCPQSDVAQFYYAGEAEREAGNMQKAREYYEKDLAINPYCPEVNNMLGAVTGQLGDLDRSIKLLELAVYVAPHYDAAYINLATAYMMKNEPDKAKAALLQYTARNGPNAQFDALMQAADKAVKQRKP